MGGTHKRRGWHNKNMRKTHLFEKNSFFQKMSFFQKNKFFSFFCLVNPYVYGYPRDPLAIVVAWVPNMGVYNQFLGASGPIKIFFWQFSKKKCRNSAKNGQKCPKSKSPNPPIKTYFHSKFQLIWPSNGRENPKNSLFWGRRPLLGKKVDILIFLGHLKAK